MKRAQGGVSQLAKLIILVILILAGVMLAVYFSGALGSGSEQIADAGGSILGIPQ